MVYYRLLKSFVVFNHLEYTCFHSIQKLEVIVVTPRQVVSSYHVVSQVFFFFFLSHPDSLLVPIFITGLGCFTDVQCIFYKVSIFF